MTYLLKWRSLTIFAWKKMGVSFVSGDFVFIWSLVQKSQLSFFFSQFSPDSIFVTRLSMRSFKRKLDMKFIDEYVAELLLHKIFCIHEISITITIGTYPLRGFCLRIVMRFWIFFNSCSSKVFLWPNLFLSMVWLFFILPNESSELELDCSSLETTGSRLLGFCGSDASKTHIEHTIPRHITYLAIILPLEWSILYIVQN